MGLVLGADYMSRAGSVYRDDCSVLYYMRRASPPTAKFRSCRVKDMATSKSTNGVFLLSLIHDFGYYF